MVHSPKKKIKIKATDKIIVNRTILNLALKAGVKSLGNVHGQNLSFKAELFYQNKFLAG